MSNQLEYATPQQQAAIQYADRRRLISACTVLDVVARVLTFLSALIIGVGGILAFASANTKSAELMVGGALLAIGGLVLLLLACIGRVVAAASRHLSDAAWGGSRR